MHWQADSCIRAVGDVMRCLQGEVCCNWLGVDTPKGLVNAREFEWQMRWRILSFSARLLFQAESVDCMACPIYSTARTVPRHEPRIWMVPEAFFYAPQLVAYDLLAMLLNPSLDPIQSWTWEQDIERSPFLQQEFACYINQGRSANELTQTCTGLFSESSLSSPLCIVLYVGARRQTAPESTTRLHHHRSQWTPHSLVPHYSCRPFTP